MQGDHKQPPLAGAENVAKAWNVRDTMGESGIPGLEAWTCPEGCGVPSRVLSKESTQDRQFKISLPTM